MSLADALSQALPALRTPEGDRLPGPGVQVESQTKAAERAYWEAVRARSAAMGGAGPVSKMEATRIAKMDRRGVSESEARDLAAGVDDEEWEEIARCGVPLLEAFADWEGHFGRGGWACMIGPGGPGKTTQAMLLLQAWCRSGRRARYCTQASLIEALGSKGPSAPYKAVALLVVDEAFEADLWPRDEKLLKGVLQWRHQKRLPTIICANYSLAAVQTSRAGLGDYVFQRVVQRCGGLASCIAGGGWYQEMGYSHRMGLQLPLPAGCWGHDDQPVEDA